MILNPLAYTVIDSIGGRITPSSTSVSIDNLDRDVLGGIYKDYGIGYFNSGLVSTFSINYDTTNSNLYSLIYPSYFTNNITEGAHPPSIETKLGCGVYEGNNDEVVLRLYQVDGAIDYANDVGGLVGNTTYYITHIIDNIYGYQYAYAYSDLEKTTLVASASLSFANPFNYRYHWLALNAIDAGAGYTCYATISDYTLTKFEDFNTFSNILDNYNNFTINNSNQLSITGLSRYHDSYFAKDYGIDYFNTNFTHKFESIVNSVSIPNNGMYFPWFLSNTLNPVYTQQINNEKHIGITFEGENLYVYWNEGSGSDLYVGPLSYVPTTPYYFTVIREGGVFTFNLYSDRERTILHGTLIATLSETTIRYRYLYASNSWNDNYGTSIDAMIRNLEIPFSPTIIHHPFPSFRSSY